MDNGFFVGEQKEGYVEENLYQPFDPLKEEENNINKHNANLVFQPKFIPFYPKLLESGLSYIEVLLFGFIDFYTSDGGNGRFYFTNEQLAQILGCSTDTVSRGVSKIEKIGLVKTHRKIKAGGGQIRFVELRKNYKSDYGKTTSLTTEKLQTNNNKINNNKININTKVFDKTAKKTNPSIDELVSYLKEKTGLQTLDGTVKQNRYQSSNLLKKLKKDYPDRDSLTLAKQLIDIGLQDQYIANNLTSINYLYYNTGKIIKAFKAKAERNATITI